MIQQINNVFDVIEFIQQISAEVKDCNPFEQINTPGMYNEKERVIRSELMEKCYEVCAKQSLNFKCLVLVLFNDALTKQPE